MPHVGLCVVYLVDGASGAFLFHKHLEQIERCSRAGSIRIYAGVNRLQDEHVARLASLPFVEICRLAPTAARNSFEHAHYLDQLVAIAAADGARDIACLDVDSFPIDPRWLDRSAAALEAGSSLVGVLRKENGDVAAPHPSFMYFARAFYERHNPTFGLLRGHPRSAAFQQATGQRRLDTGAGYAVVLHEQGLPWTPLLRSNVVDDHPLLGGVYGDMIYHFGGGSRDKVFSVDVREVRRTRPRATLEELWPEIAARNEAIAADMIRRMQADFDGYVRRLLHG